MRKKCWCSLDFKNCGLKICQASRASVPWAIICFSHLWLHWIFKIVSKWLQVSLWIQYYWSMLKQRYLSIQYSFYISSRCGIELFPILFYNIVKNFLLALKAPPLDETGPSKSDICWTKFDTGPTLPPYVEEPMKKKMKLEHWTEKRWKSITVIIHLHFHLSFCSFFLLVV